MSRPKVRTDEADQLIREQALFRLQMLTNKQIAQLLESRGVKLTPLYVGELVKQAERTIRVELSLRAKVSRETI